MTKRIAASAPFLFCAVLTAAASANPGGQNFSWSFQTTSLSTSGTYQVAAAMRNGEAWPVVITDYTNGGAAATLFPTSATSGSSTTWQNIGSGFFFGASSSLGRLRAATSPDGRVAFAASASVSPYAPMGGRVSSVTGGWGALPADTKAVAFDSHGNLYTASSTSVSGVGGFSSSAPIVDLDVSPTSEIGVVTADNKFWQYSNWTGVWSNISLPGPSPTTTDAMDLAYDSFGRPHVAVTYNNSILAYDFSTVTGQWSASTLAANLSSSSTRVTLAANDDGTVGTSWIDSSGSLVYAYKHDLDSWASATVTNIGSGSSSPSQVGITYDYADLPVLAYRPYNGSYVMLAYDPVVTPEPAGLALIGLAAAALARRSRRA